jgi:Na+-transporting NADH:ubiquinone oxidoreductase subunit NqrC
MLAKLLVALLLVSGSSLVTAEVIEEKETVDKKRNVLRINQFSRRPYLAPVPEKKELGNTELQNKSAKRINRQFTSKRPHVFPK